MLLSKVFLMLCYESENGIEKMDSCNVVCYVIKGENKFIILLDNLLIFDVKLCN